MGSDLVVKSGGPELMLNQLQALNDMGFTKTKQNTKLLLRTGGNFEVVLNFLISKKELKEVFLKDRMAFKQQKKLAKLERKAHSKDHKERKEKGSKRGNLDRGFKKEKLKPDRRSHKQTEAPHIPFPTSENLPLVYLDGNNMLFVCSFLRSLVLKRQIRLAEQLLVTLARNFALKLNMAKCVVIFDDTDKHEESDSFVVCSARPRVSTSDDALVEWAETSVQARTPVGIFVTSDRELRFRLTNSGATLVKPKEWFKAALESLTGQPVDDLDTCLTAWLASQGLIKP